jgi:hypothetical protein
MRKLLVTLVAAVFLASTGAAQMTDDELQDFKQTYNNQTGKIPGFVGSIVGGEDINVYINSSESNSSYTVAAAMKGLKIENISSTAFENPSMKVYTDDDTVSTVLKSNSTYDQVRQELDEKDITYESTTTGGKVKFSIFRGLGSLANLFGLNF